MPTTKPNMLLPVPNVTETDYPTNIDTCFTNVDSHDHTTNKGLPIPTGGIADLAITVAKLAADAVETAKIKDLNVTPGKLAAAANGLTSAASWAGKTNTVYDDIVTGSVTLVGGRPVFVGMTGSSAITLAGSRATDGPISFSLRIQLDTGSGYATVWEQTFSATGQATGGNFECYFSVPGPHMVINPKSGGGAMPFKIQGKLNDGVSYTATGYKLYAVEL